MNKLLPFCLISFTALLPLAATAQELCWFDAGNTEYFKIDACIPNSDIQFYSAKGGGRLLKQATVDAMGSYSLCVQDNFKPAFVLNVSRANIKGVSGNGIVRFFDVKEFTIDDILIKAKPDITVLTFKAQSDPAKTFTLRY